MGGKICVQGFLSRPLTILVSVISLIVPFTGLSSYELLARSRCGEVLLQVFLIDHVSVQILELSAALGFVAMVFMAVTELVHALIDFVDNGVKPL